MFVSAGCFNLYAVKYFTNKDTLPFNRPEQLLWALYYLKVYPTWDQMAMTTGITEKTLRKWVGIVVNYLASIENWVRTTLTLALTLLAS